MTKILFTVTTDLTYDQRMDRICEALSKAGFEVCLLGRSKRDSKPLREKHFKQERLSCFFEKGKFFYLEFNIKLFFYTLFKPVDIISTVDLDTILPGYFVSRLRRKKFVYDAHEYFTEVIEVVKRPRIKRIWEGIERFVLSRIENAYTVSEGLKREFEKKYPLKFEVIRNVPILEDYSEVDNPEKYIIYIGAVNEGRGLEELISIMPEVNYPLLICGDGDIYEKLRQKVKSLGLENKVTFLGYVEPAKLKEYTQKAYVGYLILNPISLSYYYSLANKFFDYIHAGIPQLVVDFPEYRTINSDFEVAVLSKEDRESIKWNLTRLLNEKILYDRLKENTRIARHEFCWQKESEKLIEFYKKIK